METNSQVLIKKLRSSSVGVVECIREFKLPQTYPSMARDAKRDSNVTSQSSVQLLTKPSNTTQTNMPFKDEQIGPKLQKLKLKLSDGRDLGEFDVQIVNQNRNSITTLNVQSKLNDLPVPNSDRKDSNDRKYVQLTAGKKSISSQSAAVKYLTKPIQLEVPDTSQGVLIPIAPNMMINDGSINNQSPILVDNNKKKQVFIVQSTKNNWQVIKNIQTTNLSPIILKPHINDDQVLLTNTKQIKTVSQKVQLTHKSPIVTYKNENGNVTGVKRKIDESVFKSVKVKDKKIVNIGDSNIVMKLEGIEENNAGKNVIYVVPSNDNLTDNESIQNAELIEHNNKFLRNSYGKVNLIRKGRKSPLINRPFFNEDNEISSGHRSQYNNSLSNNNSMNDDPVDSDISSKLSIVGQALSTIGDEELKAKALKALADCGIGIERFVPTKPPPDWKSVKESHCQTNVFGMVDKKNFIKINGESDAIERIQEIEQKMDYTMIPKVSSNDALEFSENLNKMLDSFCVNKNSIEQMRKIFKVHPLVEKAHRLIEKDFKNYKKFDRNGLLNIHKAVLSNQEKMVNRQIMVLKNCKTSVDLPTTDGQTSLELAVQHGISLEIIKMLLEAGANPTASESHDSALILASKQSSPILHEFIPYLSSTNPAINNVDSEGFTALQYCAMNGYEEGVDELIRIQVDLNARDCKSGRTALFHALENEHLDICRKLLIHGAKGNIPNFAGQTVFALFDDEKHFMLRDFLQRSMK